jgi:hypothetical protein
MRLKMMRLLMGVLILGVSCRLFQPQSSQPQAISPLEPLPNEASLSRGDVIINSTDLIVMESDPLQIALQIEGTLPSPCHKLRVDLNEPDDQNRIVIEVYSLVDPNENCIQVIEPFEANIPLGSYPDGSYTVILNGEKVGDFTQ